jgi:hypothetical protein
VTLFAETLRQMLIKKKKEKLLVATVVPIRFVTNSASCSIIYTLSQRIEELFVF